MKAARPGGILSDCDSPDSQTISLKALGSEHQDRAPREIKINRVPSVSLADI